MWLILRSRFACIKSTVYLSSNVDKILRDLIFHTLQNPHRVCMEMDLQFTFLNPPHVNLCCGYTVDLLQILLLNYMLKSISAIKFLVFLDFAVETLLICSKILYGKVLTH